MQGRLPPSARYVAGAGCDGRRLDLRVRAGRPQRPPQPGGLRAIQDWFLRFELKTVPDVSEVATVGGMVKQYQVVVDPERLKAYNLPLKQVIDAIRAANRDFGGSVLELAEAEYMVRVKGYLRTLDDFRAIPLMVGDGGTPVRLADVARIQVGPEMRRGIAELDGEGEVTGAIIVMRTGRDALATIDAVKAKLDALKPGLRPGVEIVTVYDRSDLIKTVDNHGAGHAGRAVRRRGADLHRFPVPPAQRVRRDHRAAAGRADGVHRDALPGHHGEHRFAGRNCHRHRRDGRRRGGHGRERASQARTVAGASRRDARRRGALESDHGRCGRGRPGAVLVAADRDHLLRAGVRPRGAGGQAVRAARIHQELRDGGGGRNLGDAGAGADGLSDPRPHPVGAAQPAQPRADRRLSPADRRRAALPLDDGRRRRRPRSGDPGPRVATRARVHAPPRRG